MSTSTPQPAAPKSDLRVGDYRLLTKIGEGGMGVVHLAQAPDGRRVALKVLRPHIIGDDEARERLSREVASLRRVRSPRIAEVIEADPWGELPFVATRYVPGLSLHEHLRQEGVLEGEDLRFFAAGLAEAVIAVHGVGVLHRDIKPSNVLLEGRSPVLIDFGLARLAEDPRLTVTGWLLGTPGYLAPEILYGDDATVASDVHSWAATVVFAATGRPPFGRGPAMAIMDRVRRGEHDLSDVPSDLLPLLRACLAPNPLDRPEMPAALADLRTPSRAVEASDDFTMPLAIIAADDDPTDVLDQVTGETAAATEVIDPVPATTPLTMPSTQVQPSATTPLTRQQPPRTTPLTARAPVPAPPMARPEPYPTQPPVQQAARAPYMTPPPPQQPYAPPVDPQKAPPEAWRPLPSGVAKLQRGLILLGLIALVAFVFALAPYASLVLIALVALVIRTISRTGEASRDRQWRRGRHRWYDGTLSVLSSPWYLLVAAGGTLVLMLWSAGLALLVGVGLMLFRAPLVPGLLAMGCVLAVSLWWGPGSKRLRVPTRRLIVRSTRGTWAGWATVALLAVAVFVTMQALTVNGVNWSPQPGAPWRESTMVGELLQYL